MLFSVDTELCNRDGICVEACRRHIIEMKDKDTVPSPTAEAEELCVDCGHCVSVCPTGALSLATMTPEDCPEIQDDRQISEEQAEQFLRSRRSIRWYRDKPVEREKLDKLIQIAGYPPSGHNARPVRLTIVEGKAEVKRMSTLVIDWIRLMIEESSAMADYLRFDRIIGFWEKGEDTICRNAPNLIISHAPESGRLTHVDCILALAYMELAAYPMGLGATWAGFVMNATNLYPPLAEAMALPEDHKCFGVLMLGYPDIEFIRMPLRKSPLVTWLTGK